MFKEWIKDAWFWFGRWLCRIFCLLFYRLHVSGRESIPAKGPFILVCNHQSYLDPIFCGAPIRRHVAFLARESLFANPVFGFIIASVNTIPVKQDKGDLSAMKKVIGVLKQGRGVCLFPEGTRTRDGKIAPFKAGFGLLCRRGNAAVVPAVVEGAFECWPRHKRLFSPGRVDVCYGKAIPAHQARTMDDDKLVQLVTDTLRQMQNDCRLKSGKKPYDY